MITFILPGYSKHNKEWVTEVGTKLNLSHEVRPVFWDHWEDPEATLKPKKKAQDIVDILKKDEANIIAKSVGTLVAAYVIGMIPSRIKNVVLCGIPSVSVKRLEIFESTFKGFPAEKVVCFQNSNDPLASFLEVKDFMSKVNPEIKVVEKVRSDHNYPYYEEFGDFLAK